MDDVPRPVTEPLTDDEIAELRTAVDAQDTLAIFRLSCAAITMLPRLLHELEQLRAEKRKR